MGMLNARGHFFIPAMGATMLNVVMIASVLWLAPQFGMVPTEEIARYKFSRWPSACWRRAWRRRPFKCRRSGTTAFVTSGFRRGKMKPSGSSVTQMIPGTIGVAAFQINVLLTQAIAFCVSPQIIASFDYAVRLMELPQGMFGISLATYLLPTLSGLAAEKNYSEFRGTLRHGIGTLLFANVIAAILLVVLAEPIVRLLFERGKFTADSTGRATLALMCLAPGLVAFSTVNILARAFFALGDTKTPMKISLVCLTVNLVLAALLVVPLRQGGLGIANTITSVCNAGLLFFALRKKLGKLEMESLRATFLPLAVAGMLAGLVAWSGWWSWENYLGHKTIALKIGAVFVPAGVAGLVYWLLALAFKIPAAKEMAEFALARFKTRN